MRNQIGLDYAALGKALFQLKTNKRAKTFPWLAYITFLGALVMLW